jgi:hypothetical protein
MTRALAIILLIVVPAIALDTWFYFLPNPDSDQVTEYKVYERTGTNYTYLLSVLPSADPQLMAYVSNVTAGTHYYIVTAVNVDGESDPSVDFESFIPAAPTAPTFTTTLTP